MSSAEYLQLGSNGARTAVTGDGSGPPRTGGRAADIVIIKEKRLGSGEFGVVYEGVPHIRVFDSCMYVWSWHAATCMHWTLVPVILVQRS